MINMTDAPLYNTNGHAEAWSEMNGWVRSAERRASLSVNKARICIQTNQFTNSNCFLR